MSDKEFDQLVNELKTLDPTYVDTVTYDDHTEGFAKAKHDLITGTLAKCKNGELKFNCDCNCNEGLVEMPSS